MTFNSLEDETSVCCGHIIVYQIPFQFLWGWNRRRHVGYLRATQDFQFLCGWNYWKKDCGSWELYYTFNSLEDETYYNDKTKQIHNKQTFNSLEDETKFYTNPILGDHLNFQFPWGWNSTNHVTTKQLSLRLSIPWRMKRCLWHACVCTTHTLSIPLRMKHINECPTVTNYNTIDFQFLWGWNVDTPFMSLPGGSAFNSFEDET